MNPKKNPARKQRKRLDRCRHHDTYPVYDHSKTTHFCRRCGLAVVVEFLSPPPPRQ